ncbi:hypothetical protein QTL91_24540, partial [Salmonella enterica subsp. enterica serovar Typhimurium]|nr:hypothetical protein [Salmonella enterica subsp. enterica serovar Typhimurium]
AMMSARQGDFPVTHDTYLKLYQLSKPNLSSRYTGQILFSAKKIWAMMSARQGDFPVTHDTYLKLYQLSKPNLSSRYT